MNKRKIGVIALILIIFATFVGGITYLLLSMRDTEVLDRETALKVLDRKLQDVNVIDGKLVRGDISQSGTSVYESLPDIDKYPYLVAPTTDFYIEIMSSTEKATVSDEAPYDRLLVDLIKEFDKTGPTVGGRPGSVVVRGVASGVAKDYIASGRHLPDVFWPSHSLWGDSLLAQGVPIEMVRERTFGNVAGVAISKTAHQKLLDEHGEVSTQIIDDAVIAGTFNIGYSNPMASSAGSNKLLSLLYTASPKDPLSEVAVEKFSQFQENVPLVAYTTLQMTSSAVKGRLDGFVTEAQQFKNSNDFSSFSFIPFGIRHDNPVYTIGYMSDEKRELLELFLDFTESPEAQELATRYGFNQYDEYVCEVEGINGTMLEQAQSLFKEKKSGDKEVVAVFVVDTSGSMSGSAINSVKEALRHGSQYISEDCSIGLVSFNSTVTRELPISKFDLDNLSYFIGAVDRMEASGNTAIYDALAVASKMIADYVEQNPNTRPIMFLLSDGERRGGLYYEDLDDVLAGLEVPINTISYNGDYKYLLDVAGLNEGAFIKADEEDVVYKIAAFFNSEL